MLRLDLKGIHEFNESFKRAIDAVKNHTVNLTCSMSHDCKKLVSYIDNKGFVYCADHGASRRASGVPSRKMTGSEIKKLERGEPIRYRR